MHRRRITPLIAWVLALASLAACSGVFAGGVSHTVESAEYSAAIRGKVLDVSGVFTVQVLGDGRTFVPLLPPQTSVSDLKVEKGEAHPYRGTAGVGFAADKKGEYRIFLRFVLDVAEKGRTGSVVFPLSRAAAGWIDLALPAGYKAETRPEAPVAPGTAHTARIFAPAADKIEIRWFPKEYEKEADAVVQVRERSAVRVEAGLVVRDVKLELKVARGKVDGVVLRLPENAVIRALSGETVKEWRAEPKAEGREVAVAFREPLEGDAALELSTQTPFKMDTPLALKPIVAEGAAQQRGTLVVAAGAEVSLREVGPPQAGARKAEAPPAKDGAPILQYEYDSSAAEVRLVVEAAKPRITANVQSLAVLERGIISLSSVVEYAIRGAKVRTFDLKVPTDVSVMAVTGEGPLDWTADAGRVFVRLRGHAREKYTLKVEAQQNLLKMNGIPIPLLETLDTESETGMVGVAVGEGVNLIPFSATRARQVDAAQLPPWMLERCAKLGYAYTEKGGAIAVSAIRVEPRVTAVMVDLAQVGTDAVLRRMNAVCTVAERPMFAFDLKIPDGAVVTDVKGDKVRDWVVKQAGRLLTVNLVSETVGECAFSIEAETRRDKPAESASLEGFELSGADKVDGRLAVAALGDEDLKSTATTGLTAVAVSELPLEQRGGFLSKLGYKFGRVGWTLALDVLPLAPEVDATVLSLLRFRPGLLSAVVEAQCNIRKAGVNTFEIELPKGALNSTVEADGMRSSEFKGGVWRIELMNKVAGEYVFTINYDVPLGGLSGAMSYTGARLRGTKNQTGFDIVCQEKSDAEIAVSEVVGATVVNETEIPREFAARVTVPIVRTYRWAAPERRIEFKITGHLAGKTLQATVPKCEISTLLKREGQALHYLLCEISNTNKQFVKVDLDPEARLWAAYVDGRPVKAARASDGGVLVPILGKGRYRPMKLSLIWASAAPQMGLADRVGLAAPRMDVQVQGVTWKVFMPGEYQIIGAGGNMEMQPVGAKAAGLPTMVEERLGWIVAAVLAVLAGMIGPLAIMVLIAALLLALVVGMLYLRRIWRPLVAALVVLALLGLLVSLSLPTLSRMRLTSQTELAYAPESVQIARELGEREHVKRDGYRERESRAVISAPSDKDEQASGVMLRKRQAAQKPRGLDDLRADAVAAAKGEAAKPLAPAAPLVAQLEVAAEGAAALNQAPQRAGAEVKEEVAKDKGVVQPPATPAPAMAPGVAPPPAVGKAFARPAEKPADGSKAVAGTALPAAPTVAPIAAVEKLAMMQQEAATQLVSNLVGGRAKGALPLENITFPTAGTVSYEFRMPFAGETQGRITLSCVRVGVALCLQGLIALVVLATVVGFGWRRADLGALAAGAGIILFGLTRFLAGPASLEYLRTAQWAFALAFIILMAAHVVDRVRRSRPASV